MITTELSTVDVPRGTPEVDSEMFHVEHPKQGTSQDALHTRRLSLTLCVPLCPLWSERLNQTTEDRGIEFFQHVILNGFQPAKDLTTAEMSTAVDGIVGWYWRLGVAVLPLALVNEVNHKRFEHNSSQGS